MEGRSDLWKVLIIGAILALAGGFVGGVLGIFAGAGYCPPAFETLAASRLPRLKIDSRTDLLPFEVEGHLTQTTNLIEAQQYTETVVFSVSDDGGVLISGTLTISDAIELAGDLTLVNLDATGYISVTGIVTATDGLDVAGDSELDGGVTVDDTAFSVADGTGDTVISGTLTVSDTSSLVGSVTLTGNLEGSSYLSATSNITSLMRIYGMGIDAGDADIDNVGDVALDTISADDGSSFGISNDWTNAGNTVADLGTVTSMDVNSATIGGVTAFTVANSIDIGPYDLRAATLTADGLTSGRVAMATTNGQLADDSDLTFATDTLTATKIGAFTLMGKLTAGAVEIEGSGFDIDGGDVSAVTISGGLTWSAAQDMSNSAITNIGAAGTDFGADGSLTTAQTITVTAGGAVVSAGGISVTGASTFNDAVNMVNNAISNIGAGGTDFSGTGGLTLADALTISSGDATVAGDIDGAGEFQVGTFLNLTAQTEISVTNGAVFTPTGTYQLIAAAAEVTPTISTSISGLQVGDQLELHNTETAVINFAAGGTQLLKDDYPMDQYDVLGLRWNGSAWIELYRTGPRI